MNIIRFHPLDPSNPRSILFFLMRHYIQTITYNVDIFIEMLISDTHPSDLKDEVVDI